MDGFSILDSSGLATVVVGVSRELEQGLVLSLVGMLVVFTALTIMAVVVWFLDRLWQPKLIESQTTSKAAHKHLVVIAAAAAEAVGVQQRSVQLPSIEQAAGRSRTTVLKAES